MNMPNLINLYKLDEFGEHDVGDNLRDLQALKKCQTGRWMSRDELNAKCKALFWEQKSSSHNHKPRSVQTLETEICKWREVEMFRNCLGCLEAQHFSQGLEDQNAQALAAMETALFAIDGLRGFGQHEVS